MMGRITDCILGEKVANSETRHQPMWFPSPEFGFRILGDRLALFRLAPYKPPYRRHFRLKFWISTSVYHRAGFIELDLDERTLDVDLYR
jgi:hypothetical protein